MLQVEQLELLQRYHDGEVSEAEAAEVEALLARDRDALEALGLMDDMADLMREADDHELAMVSFDGLWDGVKAGIAEQAAADAAAAKKAEQGSGGFLQWLKELFVGHKGAWITAMATAAAVALVLSFVGDRTGEPTIEKVVEKHYIYVDSVNKADPESTVVVNSMQDEGSAVIWLLPNAAEGNDAPSANDETDEDEDADDSDGVIIETEPL